MHVTILPIAGRELRVAARKRASFWSRTGAALVALIVGIGFFILAANGAFGSMPTSQGLMMFTALQVQNVPSKLLTFPDEGHWVLKPGNSAVWHNVVMDWLHRYLGGAEADPKTLEMVYSVTK